MSGPTAIDLRVLRELFRNLQAFEALHETEGIDTLLAPDGTEWSLWDVQYLYQCLRLLSPRQRQAIELCLHDNLKERDAARHMGISEDNPVSVYANNGLKRLIAMAQSGALPHYRIDAAMEAC